MSDATKAKAIHSADVIQTFSTPHYLHSLILFTPISDPKLTEKGMETGVISLGGVYGGLHRPQIHQIFLNGF